MCRTFTFTFEGDIPARLRACYFTLNFLGREFSGKFMDFISHFLVHVCLMEPLGYLQGPDYQV